MLRWIAAVLFAGRPITVRQLRARHNRVRLDALTRIVIQLLIIRSAEFMRPRRGARLRFFLRGRDLRRRHYIRSLLGARLRRVLKPKNVAQRIDNLIRVLRHLEYFARRLCKRRITRLWSVKPAPTSPVVVPAAPAATPAFANSS